MDWMKTGSAIVVGAMIPFLWPRVKQPEDLDLEWSPQLKQQMPQDIDRSIEGTRAMVGCLKSSDSGDQMEACMEKTGLMKKR